MTIIYHLNNKFEKKMHSFLLFLQANRANFLIVQSHIFVLQYFLFIKGFFRIKSVNNRIASYKFNFYTLII